MVHSAGDTILGADDRAGLAAAIETVRRIVERDDPHPTIRIVFTVQEEVGLHGAKTLAPRTIAGDLCLVLDADGEPGGIVVAAPTHYTFFAEFQGRASHAGVAPEQGVSAITMAANAICAMELGRLDAAYDRQCRLDSRGARDQRRHGALRDDRRVPFSRPRARRVGSLGHGRRHARRRREAGGTVDVAWHLEYEGFALPRGCREIELVSAAIRDVGSRADARTAPVAAAMPT